MLRSSVAAAILLFAATASAQPAPQPPPNPPDQPQPPILRLSAIASVKLAPDELVADLRAVGIAPTPVAAQRQVNDLMARAKAATDGMIGVTASFQDYFVGQSDDHPVRWTAQQVVELRSGDGNVVLDLVGRLQSIGLAIGDLGWRVSIERAEQAREDATLKALAALRRQAVAAATALGTEVDRLQSVSLNEPPGIVPLARGRMAAATALAAPMPPPNATPDAQDVFASASAEIVLRAAPLAGPAKP